ncbi:DUF6230 family protein [Streptacidiphilus jiangxiensis]|uniref:Cholesterol esterase n=1 Tax=Streptacidiphilus jiangxiensis TaxID=235985 RepID=A0A1H7UW16_STRJI|nr:DUF6230 family protein [Streptacidiphilus jiangxiensis]SEM01006.1 hypothetical protein SAMN05414137_116201 [Streptacidiphilus jiangxiensis]
MNETSHGTRWGRTAVAALPALVCAGGIGAAVGSGALAAGLQVQGGSLEFATSSLYGTQFGAAVVEQATSSTTAGGAPGSVHVLRLGFADGLLDGLCLSQEQTIGGLPFTLTITLGDKNPGTWEVRTQNTVLDLTSVTGTLDMDGLVDLNINGPDVTTVTDSTGAFVPDPLGSSENRFGIQAHYAKFDQVTGTVQDIQIPGLLQTPAIGISVQPGNVPCPTPPAPTGTP